jgi:hypothetical protein
MNKIMITTITINPTGKLGEQLKVSYIINRIEACTPFEISEAAVQKCG